METCCAHKHGYHNGTTVEDENVLVGWYSPSNIQPEQYIGTQFAETDALLGHKKTWKCIYKEKWTNNKVAFFPLSLVLLVQLSIYCLLV